LAINGQLTDHEDLGLISGYASANIYFAETEQTHGQRVNCRRKCYRSIDLARVKKWARALSAKRFDDLPRVP